MTETTRTTKDTAIMIKVSNLYPHPDNPRKDLGDLTELVESIKKNGIMSNRVPNASRPPCPIGNTISCPIKRASAYTRNISPM